MATKWQKTKSILEIHTCAIRGLTKSEAAAILGVTPTQLYMWLRDKPEAKEAWEHGDALRGTIATEKAAARDFNEYIFRQLPEELQAVWEEALGPPNTTTGIDYRASANLIRSKGDSARKRIFAHALVSTNWDMNLAMSMCGITRAEYVKWSTSDDAFSQAMADVQFYRQNFFEQQLHNLVARQEPSAVIFANKTINRDRGYGDTVAVKHSGNVNHTGSVDHKHLHGVVNLGSLNLPVDVLRQVMQAIEAQGDTTPQPTVVRTVENGTVSLPPGVIL